MTKVDVAAIMRRIALENSHPFIKLEEKSQILIPKTKNFKDLYRTRLTHSYETSSIARIIGFNIGFDRLEELENVSLAHDLGHPAFGHTGAELLHKKSVELGIPEGFSDNSATFEVIKHNSLDFSDYELASLIKYPDSLYFYQKEYLLPKLKLAVERESVKWGSGLKRTVACEIMDISDRISYGTSDLVDSFNTGYTRKSLAGFLKKLAKKVSSNRLLNEILLNASFSAESDSKRLVRASILKLKMAIINDLYWSEEKATLRSVNKETFFVLDSICQFTFEEFIKNESVIKIRDRGVELFGLYFDYFIKNPTEMPSSFYYDKYKNAKSDVDKYRAVRDMVADSTDQFVMNFTLKNIKKR